MKQQERAEKLRAAAIKFKDAMNEYLDVVGAAHLSLNRGAAEAALGRAPRIFLAYCALVKALKSHRSFFSQPSSIVIVNVPPNWSLDDLDYVCELCFGIERRRPSYFGVFLHPVTRNKKGGWDFVATNELRFQKVMVIARSGSELHPEVEAAADIVIDLDPMQEEHIAALSRMLKTEIPSPDDCRYLRQLPCSYIDYVFRRGRSPGTTLSRIRLATERSKTDDKILPLHVFGDAAKWAESFQRDLEAWRDGRISWQELEKGVLLYGPPGTGKTSFAASLAAHLNLPLIATSLGRWQSAGHLGDLLRSMYADFARAKSESPAILFIDELDSIGDRGKFDGPNAGYSTEVVNALLEAIDGSLSRKGVIVIGASNHPGKIDPAILRPGRLERHIKLQKPGLQQRVQMLSFYLSTLPQSVLHLAAVRMDGFTGADIEFFARRVKQRARTAGTGITAAEVEAELPPEVIFDAQDRWRICIHEAGHTVLVRRLLIGRLISVKVTTDGTSFDNETIDAYGRVEIERPRRFIESETSIRNEIAMSLGGMAAEHLFVGDRSTTAGGADGSDLETATAHAARMVLKFGLGAALPIVPNLSLQTIDAQTYKTYPYLRSEINDVLQQEYRRATEILNDNEAAVLALARALENASSLDPAQVDQLITNPNETTAHRHPSFG